MLSSSGPFRPRWLACLLALLGPGLAGAAPPEPTGDRGEIAGTICLRTVRTDAIHRWKPDTHYTGSGLLAVSAGADRGWAEFTFTVNAAGTFHLYLLGTRRIDTPARASAVAVTVDSADVPGFGGARATVQFRELNAVAWSDLDASGRPGAELSFPAPGRYRLRLAAAGEDGFFVEKILLCRAATPPTGMGPAETDLSRSTQTDLRPVLPPAWAFGVIYGGYTDQAGTLAALDRLAAGDFPVDAYWIDSWFWNFANEGKGPAGYLSFVEDRTAFPNVAAMWGEFQRRGIKAGVWIWDCILRDGNEAVFDEFDRDHLFSGTFVQTDRWHNQPGRSRCGNIDFTSPAAVELWQRKLAPLFAAGLDFLKIDRSSDISFSRAAFETTQRLGRETKGRGFILAHLHSTYDPRHKLYPAKWTGDAKIAWTQPDYPNKRIYAMGGLRENIEMVADPKRSTYEVPFLAHDAGGYSTFGDGVPSDELYARWLQFASLNTLTTFFSFQANPTRNHPSAYPPAIQAIARHYLHLRLRLFPYLYSCALETRLTGLKPVQGDGVHEEQYQLGPSLLVAPVFTPGAVTREVFLPEGRWFEWDSGPARDGGRTVTLDAPLEKLPLLVPAGALVPLRDYAASVGAGNNHHLTLEAYPGPAPSSFTLREDDGTSNDYLDGGFASTPMTLRPEGGASVLEISPVQGSYAGMEPARRWTVRLHDQPAAKTAQLNGQDLAVRHDPATQTLTVEFTGQKAVAQVLVFR